MRIIHRISFPGEGPVAEFFRNNGFNFKPGLSSSFDIAENEPGWELVKEAYRQFGHYALTDFQYKTEFSKDEMENARFFKLVGEWHFDYPQPSANFAYKDITYKSGSGCRKCGMGMEQQRPFSFKKEPAWDGKNIFQTNWVFGEYFISGDLKKRIEGIPDLEFMEVLKYQGEVFDNIFQIIVKSSTGLEMPSESVFSICSRCKGKKYPPHTKGYFPNPQQKEITIARTREHFGSAAEARQEILVNREVWLTLVEAGINGAGFIPCSKNKL